MIIIMATQVTGTGYSGNGEVLVEGVPIDQAKHQSVYKLLEVLRVVGLVVRVVCEGGEVDSWMWEW